MFKFFNNKLKTKFYTLILIKDFLQNVIVTQLNHKSKLKKNSRNVEKESYPELLLVSRESRRIRLYTIRKKRLSQYQNT